LHPRIAGPFHPFGFNSTFASLLAKPKGIVSDPCKGFSACCFRSSLADGGNFLTLVFAQGRSYLPARLKNIRN